jgi:uncharacterized caspase-like protein
MAKRAVVIGIDKYAGPKIEKLSGAVLDAEEIYQVLTQNGKFVIKDEHFLINENATSYNIRTAISDLFWHSDEKCGTALIFFAGHGRHDHLGYGYLIPHDVDLNAPYIKGICIQELKRLFIDSKVNTSAILILDCCYSGIATGARGDGAQEVDAIRGLLSDVLRSDDTGSGRFILASARADEKAREKKQKHTRGSEEEHVHGIYSFHLIEALRGAAADKNGYVSLGNVIRHIDNVFRSNDPDGIPPISGAGIDMDGIWLTEIAERVTEHLRERYGLIGSFITSGTPGNLLAAIDEIIDLESRGAGAKELLSGYVERIEPLMAEFTPKCQQWWFNNGSILRRDPDIDQRRCGIVRDLLTDLSIENYRNRNLGERGFLTEIVEAIVTDQNYRAVTKYMRDQKPAPRIGRENIRAPT